MPDWIAHLSLAYIIAALLRIKHKEFVIIGAMIPDLVQAFNLILFGLGIDRTTAFLAGLPFHSLLFGLLMAGALGAFFFRGLEFRLRTCLLALGMASHLLLDGIMLYTIVGVRVWIPLSYARPDALNALPSQSYVPALILGAAALAVFLGLRIARHNNFK